LIGWALGFERLPGALPGDHLSVALRAFAIAPSGEIDA
jgi:hypothetical protein